MSLLDDPHPSGCLRAPPGDGLLLSADDNCGLASATTTTIMMACTGSRYSDRNHPAMTADPLQSSYYYYGKYRPQHAGCGDAQAGRVVGPSLSEAQLLAALDRFGRDDEDAKDGSGGNNMYWWWPWGKRRHDNDRPTNSTSPLVQHPHRDSVHRDSIQQQDHSSHQNHHWMGLAGAVANLCSATLGAGVLSLPYAVAQAGLVGGLVLLTASAYATAVSIRLLAQACHVARMQQHTTLHFSYEALVEYWLGKPARKIAEASMLLFCGGCAVAYVIAVGDIWQQSQKHPAEPLSPSTNELSSFSSASMDAQAQQPSWTISISKILAMTLVWTCAMMPLSMLRTMKSLQCASSLGIASIATLVVAACYHWMVACDDQNGGDSEHHRDQQHWVSPLHGIMSVLKACPIILFAFSCQVNVCAIYEELEEPPPLQRQQQLRQPQQPPQQEESRRVGDTAVDLYLDEAPPSTTNADNAADFSVMVPNRQLDESATNTNNGLIISPHKFHLMNRVALIAVTICALLYTSISIVAILDFGPTVIQPNILSNYNPHHPAIMQVAFLGMALAVVLAYPMNIFPARMTLVGVIQAARHQQQQSTADLMLTEPLLAADNDNDPQNRIGRGEAPEEQRQKRQDLVAAVSSKGEGHNAAVTISASLPSTTAGDSSSLAEHVSLTLLLTGMSLGFALVAPNISVVFGLLGGTSSSILGFILPGLLGYQTAGGVVEGNGRRIRAESIVLVVAGVVIGILTTGVTVYTTFAAP